MRWHRYHPSDINVLTVLQMQEFTSKMSYCNAVKLTLMTRLLSHLIKSQTENSILQCLQCGQAK